MKMVWGRPRRWYLSLNFEHVYQKVSAKVRAREEKSSKLKQFERWCFNRLGPTFFCFHFESVVVFSKQLPDT
jgi:hypothetical protein